MTLTEIDPPGLVTAAEAALIRGVTARAVRFWTSEGLQVPVNLGAKGPRLYRIQEVTKAELTSRRRLATRNRSQIAG